MTVFILIFHHFLASPHSPSVAGACMDSCHIIMSDFPSVISLSLFSLIIVIDSYVKKCKKPTLYTGSKKNQQLLAKCPSLNKVFWPSPFVWNNHLQIVHFSLMGGKWRRAPFIKWTSELVTLPDGQQLVLDWKYPNDTKPAKNDSSPIVIILPGMSGDSFDIPGQDYIVPAIQRGWSVCVLNRRGHVLPLTRPKFNFFGCCEDLHFVTQHILSNRPHSKLFGVGISAGSGFIARHFGKDPSYNDFTAGVSICPGYNIEKCMGRVGFPYQGVMLDSVKEYYQAQNGELFKDTPGYDTCMQAQDFQFWLDHCYAMAGYGSKEEFYQHTNPMNYVYKIPASKPCLAINAIDDPICVMENVEEYLSMLQESEGGASLVVTHSGSHCPFYEGFTHANWAEKVSYEFFDAVLSELENDTAAAAVASD